MPLKLPFAEPPIHTIATSDAFAAWTAAVKSHDPEDEERKDRVDKTKKEINNTKVQHKQQETRAKTNQQQQQ